MENFKSRANFILNREEALLLTDSVLNIKKTKNEMNNKEAFRWIIYIHDHSSKKSAFLATDSYKMCLIEVTKLDKNKDFNLLMFKLPKIISKDVNLAITMKKADNLGLVGEVTFFNTNKEEDVETRNASLEICPDIEFPNKDQLTHVKRYKGAFAIVRNRKKSAQTTIFNPILLPRFESKQSIRLEYDTQDSTAILNVEFVKDGYKNTSYILMPLADLTK